MIRIYGLKNCDNCRKAMKSLPDAELIDIREDRLPDKILSRALDQFGDKLVNTRSTTWRQLEPSEKTRTPRELLAAYPTLMKRPLIETSGEIFLSWNKDVECEVKALS